MVRIVHRKNLEKSFRGFLDLSVELNRLFFELSQDGPMEYRDYHPKRPTKELIQRVRKDKHLRKKVRRIVERFPYNWPIEEQAAYILRAFSGLQLFPDANHRTGLAIMRAHIHHHGYGFRMDGVALKEFIEKIRDPRSPYSARCNAGQLVDRDRSFRFIASTILLHIYKRSLGSRAIGLFSHLFGRRGVPVPLLYTAYETPEEEAERKQGGGRKGGGW